MKPRKAAVIGIGHVGAHVANVLASQGTVNELILIDKNRQKAISEVQDLRDALLWNPHEVDIRTGDYADLKDCDIIVTSFGDIQLLVGTSDRINELAFNIKAASDVGEKIRNSGFSGVIINISNPCDVITRQLAVKTGLPKGHVFGTGTALDTSRLISALSQQTGLSRQSINAFMMGEHGNLQFSPASLVTFRGAPWKAVCPDIEIPDWKELEKEAIQGGWVTFAGKHCTEYGISSTAARLAQAVLEDQQVLLPVSAPLTGEYGQSGLYAGVPAIIGRQGITRVVEMPLTPEELDTFADCCDGIRKNIRKGEELDQQEDLRSPASS